jgi:hypothetical protein
MFHGGAWVVPVALVLGVICGFGDLAQSREKAARRIAQDRENMVRRIEEEERIREQVRREMRDE